MLRFRDDDCSAAFRSIAANMAQGHVQLRARLAATGWNTRIGPDNPKQHEYKFLFFDFAL